MIEEVVLVNENDVAIGTMEKLEAHQKGLLHRAFSVFIFNDKNELLLQRRALTKYHSAGLWTNTCCSHPRPNETTLNAANRRLVEEMGIETELIFKTSFIYKTKFDNGLTEHEFDHIFFGTSNENPIINTEEVDSFVWMSVETLKQKINLKPNEFTSWFKIAVKKLFK
jgi:isopentenyl-diphosphate delta-isomerase